jgi:formate hydrogenlyase transcriptional activator
MSLATRYESLLRLLQSLSVFRNGDNLCNFVVAELANLINYDIIGITSYDKQARELTWLMLELRKHRVLPRPIPWEGTASQWVSEHQEPLAIHDVDQEARFPITLERIREQGGRSLCMFPLKTAMRHIGTIYFCTCAPHIYYDDEIRFLSLVAGTIGMAVGNARCFEGAQVVETELYREKNRLKLLLDLTNCLVSYQRLEDMLHAVAVLLRQIFQCDVAGIMLPDAKDERSRISAFDYSGRDGLVVSATSFPWDRVFREVLEIRESWSGDVKDIPMRVRQDPPYRMVSPVKQICGFPLNRSDRTLGVLALGRLSENAFTADDIALLAEVSKQVAIAIENSLDFSCIANVKDNLAHEKLYLLDEIRTELVGKEIIGESGALRSVLQKVETVATTDSTVLICGETGTGKELIARALHNLSSRRTYPFVKLNCAAIPAGVLESELFGHEKGAFTGAIAQRLGRFEMANHGTLFLDEIGELPLELQPKLLHVLQEQSFERLGSSRTIQTNARLIAATNRDLEAMVARKEFRLDLFYRLNVFPIQVPPLRERVEDIPLLVRSFVQRFANRANRKVETISSNTMDALCSYEWPGNIRELQNVLERAVILSTGPVLDIPLSDLRLASAAQSDLTSTGTLNDAERRHIIAVLNETGWVLGGKNGAAERLGLKRPTLQFRMKKLGIVRPSICESDSPTQVY